jgi:hypothetical protein
MSILSISNEVVNDFNKIILLRKALLFAADYFHYKDDFVVNWELYRGKIWNSEFADELKGIIFKISKVPDGVNDNRYCIDKDNFVKLFYIAWPDNFAPFNLIKQLVQDND